MKHSSPRWFSSCLLLILALAVLIRLFYWDYTGRTWDDALITALHSENAASGFGLTHINPGESPVQGFTSPLAVLLSLVADLIHVGYGLSFLKLLSAFFGGVAVWMDPLLITTSPPEKLNTLDSPPPPRLAMNTG